MRCSFFFHAHSARYHLLEKTLRCRRPASLSSGLAGRARLPAILLLLLLTSCAGPPSMRQHAQRATPTTVSPRPSPVAALLDPPPTGCPASVPPPHVVSVNNQFGIPGAGHLLGSPPVWITDFSYPTSPLHLDVGGYTAWPQWKVVWEVGPNFAQPVHLQVRDLRTGERAWWGSQPATWIGPTFLLDPAQPDANGAGWYRVQRFDV
jgi:hypothetical protein